MFPIAWCWIYHTMRTFRPVRVERAPVPIQAPVEITVDKAVAAFDKLIEALKAADTTGKG
jgi:hypothetical protein